ARAGHFDAKSGVSSPDRSVYAERTSRHDGRESVARNTGVEARGTNRLRQRASESRGPSPEPTEIAGSGGSDALGSWRCLSAGRSLLGNLFRSRISAPRKGLEKTPHL